jgi:FdhD protein
VSVHRFDQAVESIVEDDLTNEVPIAISYQGVSHVVMLATPTHLEALAIGFSLTEGLVHSADEILEVKIEPAHDHIAVQMTVTAERFSHILTRQRHLSGRTGCGLCGSATLADAIRSPKPLKSAFSIDAQMIQQAIEAFSAHQQINKLTGSVHAAAWVTSGGIQTVFEDVGRHNALDKLIGQGAIDGTNFSQGFVLLSSRASFELIQKSAMVGIGMLVAVSAPTALAVKTAQEFGITLVGFARPGRHVVYSCADRLRGRSV